MLSLNESLLPSAGWEKLFVLGGVILLALAGWQVASYSAFQFHPEWFQHGGSNRLGCVHGREFLRCIASGRILAALARVATYKTS